MVSALPRRSKVNCATSMRQEEMVCKAEPYPFLVQKQAYSIVCSLKYQWEKNEPDRSMHENSRLIY